MITPIDRNQLHLVRGGAAANAPRVQTDASRHTSDATDRSPLARNVETLVLDAYEAGRQHGQKQHYVAGWRFGLVCGLLWGSVSVAAAVLIIMLVVA